MSDAELAVVGMRMYRKDRNRRGGGGGGGIVVYVSEDVLSVRRWDLEDEAIEALWIEVKMRKRRTPFFQPGFTHTNHRCPLPPLQVHLQLIMLG